MSNAPGDEDGVVEALLSVERPLSDRGCDDCRIDRYSARANLSHKDEMVM